MKRKAFIFSIIFVFCVGVAAFSASTIAFAAQGEEAAESSVKQLGEKESVLVQTATPVRRLLIEMGWRNRLNRVLRPFREKGVKVTDKILADAVAGLGIDSSGPFTHDSWKAIIIDGKIPPIPREIIEKYLDPEEYIAYIEELLTRETKNRSASPWNE